MARIEDGTGVRYELGYTVKAGNVVTTVSREIQVPLTDEQADRVRGRLESSKNKKIVIPKRQEIIPYY